MNAVILEETNTGITMVNGQPYMADAKGHLVPVENVRAADKLQDEMVRKILGYADDLSDQIARFKGHTFDDIGAFEAILAQEYGTTVGGAKGNKTLMTFDGTLKVQVQVADFLDFGPELQAAKTLIDECLREWTAGSNAALRGIVTDAFDVDKQGCLNRSKIFMLLRQEVEDDRWNRAMQAVRDAIRVVGSKTYVRCYRRARHDASWQAVTIDLAKA